ncbi:exostosin family-domain-containing protein [Pelagophyceae sp. CCMP2097]|nr:exostosin family-domain-containing protein [Pelagophyceae sp. CCMP2097]
MAPKKSKVKAAVARPTAPPRQAPPRTEAPRRAFAFAAIFVALVAYGATRLRRAPRSTEGPKSDGPVSVLDDADAAVYSGSVRVYVHELPPAYNVDIAQGLLGRKATERIYRSAFLAEHAIHLELLTHPSRAQTRKEATHVYVPFYPQAFYLSMQYECETRGVAGIDALRRAKVERFQRCAAEAADDLDAITKLLVQRVRRESGDWDAGVEHVFSSSMDFGRCRGNMGASATEPMAALAPATCLAHVSPAQSVCANVEKDLVIPPYVDAAAWASSADDKGNVAFFRGRVRAAGRGNELRRQLVEVLRGVKAFDVDAIDAPESPAILAPQAYRAAMRNAKLCLCVGGVAPWSPRLVESVLAGCVPVFVGESNSSPAGVDWKRAALYLPKVGPSTEDWLRLRAANETDSRARRLVLAEVRGRLVYRSVDDVVTSPKKSKRTAVDALLESLESRRLESREPRTRETAESRRSL